MALVPEGSGWAPYGVANGDFGEIAFGRLGGLVFLADALRKSLKSLGHTVLKRCGEVRRYGAK